MLVHRLVGGLCMALVAGGACARTVERAPRAPAAACPGDPLRSRLVTLPFTPERRAFAGWLDDHRAVVAELVEDRDRRAHVRAVVIDAERATVHSLGEPVVVPRYRSGSPGAVFAIVDGRLVAIVYSTVGSEQLHAFVVDPTTGIATEVAAASAPPSRAFLTSPLRAAAGRGRWALWPMTSRGVELGAGYVLDTRAATWHRVTTGLPTRAGASVTALGDGRVAVWGGREGDVQATTGVVVDLATGGLAPFRHPPVPSAVVAVHGSVLASVLVVQRSGLRGYIVDVDRGSQVELSRPLAMSSRNHEVLHADGAYLGYLAADALHLRDAASGAWRTLALPFEPNAPSDIVIATLASNAWLIDGTDRGAFRFDPRAGAFCALTLPRGLEVATTTIVSPRYRLAIGGTVMVQTTPDCPPGVPCAIPGPRRVEDPRAQITELR